MGACHPCVCMGACHPWPRQGPGRLSPVAPPGAWAPVALAAAFRRATHMRWAPRGKPCLELLGRARAATVPAFLLEPWLHAARNLAEGREHCFVPQHHSFFALLSFPFSGRRINVNILYLSWRYTYAARTAMAPKPTANAATLCGVYLPSCSAAGRSSEALMKRKEPAVRA